MIPTRIRDAWRALRGYAAAQDARASTWAAGWETKLWGGSGLLKFDANYSQNMTHYPKLHQLGARLPRVSWVLDREDGGLMPRVTQTGGPDWSNPNNYTIRPDAQLEAW